MKRPPRSFILYSLSIIIAGAIVYSPALYALIWHLGHGSSVQFLEYSVQIPQSYFADVENNRTEISKLRATLFAKGPAIAIVALSPNKPAPKTAAEKEAAFQRFPTVYKTLAGKNGTTTGPFRRGQGRNQSVCMQTIYGEASDAPVAISCLVFEGEAYATFSGITNEIQTFYRIIDNANDLPPGSAHRIVRHQILLNSWLRARPTLWRRSSFPH